MNIGLGCFQPERPLPFEFQTFERLNRFNGFKSFQLTDRFVTAKVVAILDRSFAVPAHGTCQMVSVTFRAVVSPGRDKPDCHACQRARMTVTESGFFFINRLGVSFLFCFLTLA